MRLPTKCLVDTNIPKIANLAAQSDRDNDIPADCVLACIEAIDHIIATRGLILDAGDEIFDEYRHQLSMKGQPGVGDKFIKWVHDNRWNLPQSQRIPITRNGESYDEFPTSDELRDFDISDRKFIAVANATVQKWPILQATDSKWWGWREALAEAGITVCFLCPDYVKTKYAGKMGK